MAKREPDDEPEPKPEPERFSKRHEPEPKPAPPPEPPREPRRSTREVTTFDATTQVILEEGNAPPGTGVTTDYAIGAEPARAFFLNGKYYERARVDDATGLIVYRWNDWR